jgi:isopenicillin N synthase-like dioxygenase
MADRRIPTIDLAALDGTPCDRAALARAVDDACRDLGFLVIENHGVDRALVDRVYDASGAFFALPEAERIKSLIGTVSAYNGYKPLGTEMLAATEDGGVNTGAAARARDLKESIGIGPPSWDEADPYFTNERARRFFSPNPWPDAVPGFRDAYVAYWHAMDGLSRRLMALFGEALGVGADFFAGKIDRSISHLFCQHYPGLDPAPPAGTVRAGAHTDFGSLTILHLGDNAKGLQVYDAGDDLWHDVDAPADAFVVNLGDLLSDWTGGVWQSTLHRVVIPDAEAAARSRRTLTFFHQPNYDAVVETIPTCRRQGAVERYGRTTSGAHYVAKLARMAGEPVPAEPLPPI